MAGIVVNADALCLHQGVAVRFDYLCERFYICCFPHFFIYLMIIFLLLWRYNSLRGLAHAHTIQVVVRGVAVCLFALCDGADRNRLLVAGFFQSLHQGVTF